MDKNDVIDVEHEQDIEKLRSLCQALVKQNENLKKDRNKDVKKVETYVGKATGMEKRSRREPSPYIKFVSEKRPELRAAHPNASFGEMSKMMGQMWAQMSEQEREKYTRPSGQKENSSNPDLSWLSQRALGKAATIESENEDEDSNEDDDSHKSENEFDLGPSPYILFCTEKRPKLRALFEMGKILGLMWGQMSEKQRAEYARPCAETRKTGKALVKPVKVLNPVVSENVGKATIVTPPKRQPSPYIIFCTEQRPALRAAHPNASFADMGRMLGQKWALLSEQAKAAYYHPRPKANAPTATDENFSEIIEL